MARTTASTPQKPRRKVGRSIDAQLASVIEQDGVTISSSKGTRRHTTRLQSKEILRDPVQSLDHATVFRVAVDGPAAPQKKTGAVPIRRREHARSPFVVSLQRVPVSTRGMNGDERVPVAAALGSRPAFASAAPVGAYASVSTDLTSDIDPWSVAEQFTHADFETAYAAVYGRFDRVSRVLRDAASSLVGLFHRVEQVEEQAVEEFEEMMSMVEVPRFSFVRAMAGFAGLALIVTLPANAIALYRTASDQKSAAVTAGTQAMGDVMAAANAGSIPDSAEALKHASSRFREADAMLSDSSALAFGISSVLPKTYRTARALLEVGDKSAEAARVLSLGFDKIFSDPDRRLDERLDLLGAYARGAMTLLSDASKAAATVDPSAVPAAQRDKVTALLSRLDQSTQAVQEVSALADTLSTLSGKYGLRKYLIVFQNQTELRPTGGFMGSFAEVTLDRGEVKGIRVPPGGTYDLQGQLVARVAPPKPLQLVSALWQFQDANWSPDFPTAAEQIRWFWSKSGQATVDGVIAINASFVERLLDVTGPIDMPEYGKTIDASNFLLETQKAVELEYDKTANTPKKFVGDLAPKLVERLKHLDKQGWLKVARLLSDALETKDIQASFRNPDEEQVAERYGWNGRLKETAGDTLAVIEANIAGQKTDGVIAEQATHQVKIADDGTIEDTLTLTRTHEGKKGELFRGVRNVSYLRVYVPEGSTLIAADGFRAPERKFFKTVDEDVASDPQIKLVEAATNVEHGVDVASDGSHTVFGGWLQLDPGMSQTITLTYRLPMTASDILTKLDAAPNASSPGDAAHPSPRGAYTLLETSQSGKTGRKLTTTVEVPPSWKVVWGRPATQQRAWDRDLVTVALFTPDGQTH